MRDANGPGGADGATHGGGSCGPGGPGGGSCGPGGPGGGGERAGSGAGGGGSCGPGGPGGSDQAAHQGGGGGAHGGGGGHSHIPSGAGAHKGRLAWALGLAATVLAVEVVGAIWTGSLALLADAGHMAADSIGLVFALVAASLAERPSTAKRTYGLKRIEVLAALSNGLIVVAIAVGVAVEGIQRLTRPNPVEATPVLVLAAVGLVANVIALLILRSGARESINVRGAYLEVVGDSLGSVAVIASAAVIIWTGWLRADAVASLVIAALILPRAYALLSDVVRVLMEATPKGMDLDQVRGHLEQLPGVVSVHDLHAWTITSGLVSLTAHVVVRPDRFNPEAYHELLDQMASCLSGHFDLTHSTFQIEPADHTDSSGLHP